MDRENKRKTGSLGEEMAVEHLKEAGYCIIHRNYRVGRLGEVDIIAQDGPFLCFIEVKARSSFYYGMPSEAVDARKQQKIRMLASIYASRATQMNARIRFDVVEVMMVTKQNGKKEKGSINILRNAF